MTDYVIWYDPNKATGADDGTSYADAYQAWQDVRDGINAISSPPAGSTVTVNIVAGDAVDTSLTGTQSNGGVGDGSRINAQANLTTITLAVVDSAGAASTELAPWLTNYDDLSSLSADKWGRVTAGTYGFDTDGAGTSKLWRLQDNSVLSNDTEIHDLVYFEKTAGTDLYDAAFSDVSEFPQMNSTSGLPGQVRAFSSNTTYRANGTTRHGQTWTPYADAQFSQRDDVVDLAINSVADNGSGNCRYTTASAHNLGIGELVDISAFVTNTAYNATGEAVTNVTSTTTFDTAQSFGSDEAGTLNAGTCLIVYADGSHPSDYYDVIYTSPMKAAIYFYEWTDITITGKLRCKYVTNGLRVRHSNASEVITTDWDFLDADGTHFRHCSIGVALGRGSAGTTRMDGTIKNIGGTRTGCNIASYLNHDPADTLTLEDVKLTGSGTTGASARSTIKLETQANGGGKLILKGTIGAYDSPRDRNDIEPAGAFYFEEGADVDIDISGKVDCRNVCAALMHNNTATQTMRVENIVTSNVPHLLLMTTRPAADSNIDIGYCRMDLPAKGAWLNWLGTSGDVNKIGASVFINDRPAAFSGGTVKIHSMAVTGGSGTADAFHQQYLWGGQQGGVTFESVYTSGLDGEILEEDGTTENTDAAITQTTRGAVSGPYPAEAEAQTSTARWSRRDARGIPHTGFARNAYEWTPLASSASFPVAPRSLHTYTGVSGGKVTFDNLVDGDLWLYYNNTGTGTARVLMPRTDNAINASETIQVPALTQITVVAKDTSHLPSYDITIEARGFGDDGIHVVATGALEFTLTEGVETAITTIPTDNNGTLRIATDVDVTVNMYDADDDETPVNSGPLVAKVYSNIDVPAGASRIAFVPQADGFAAVNAVQDD